MKLLHLTVHFEYTDAVEQILLAHGVRDFARYPMVEGLDSDGRHYGNQAFPGNITVVQAQLEENQVDPLFQDLATFRGRKPAHGHLQALILPVERKL
jgi:tRNA A37 threonylcarbamoyladenosine synthetase subunit TsaC/SUA5/YrdC